ncbi:hypothetical protein DY000_02021462 [Brassica cretica]|uniref:Uncharacterized protein n=1 Tax=Brassica cretica TaxID=69181 RepID=A0ABQ7ECE7_BRACR|nr:hypothetical protein DY000_02021462 [Brassica cretica]
MHEKKINNLSGGEWKPTTEKPKLKLETINNLTREESIHRENNIQTWSSRYGERESHKRRDQRSKINLTEKEGEEKQEHGGESFPSDGKKHCTPER